MGLKEIETPNAMISYFAEQLGPLIEKSEIKQPTYLYWESFSVYYGWHPT